MNLHGSSFFLPKLYSYQDKDGQKKKKDSQKMLYFAYRNKKDTGLCYKVSLKLIASTTLRLLYRPLLRHYKA